VKSRFKLLVCIAFHYNESRVKYVKQLIDNYTTYDEDIDIIVDCNIQTSFKNAKVYEHILEKPYFLTYVHRKHFVDNIDSYDYFMYVEDDMLVTYDAFNEYVSNFNALWELGYVPSFIRVEHHDGKKFITDATKQQSINVITINGKFFANLSESYHAFWIMPQKQLKESITPDFIKLDEWREKAASYPSWQLLKTPLVRIENNQISELSYSYHLPNNYASNPNSIFGKIEIKNLIKN
jgi:hypothetical protein